jgi:hypothetical protein
MTNCVGCNIKLLWPVLKAQSLDLARGSDENSEQPPESGIEPRDTGPKLPNLQSCFSLLLQ